MGNAPNSNVEFSTLVQKRFLKVFLNYPVGELQRAFDKSGDVIDFVEDLDTLTLILICRFH